LSEALPAQLGTNADSVIVSRRWDARLIDALISVLDKQLIEAEVGLRA